MHVFCSAASHLFHRSARCTQVGSGKPALRSPSLCTLRAHSAAPCTRRTPPACRSTDQSTHQHTSSCMRSLRAHTSHADTCRRRERELLPDTSTSVSVCVHACLRTCCSDRGSGRSSVHTVGRCGRRDTRRSRLPLLSVCRPPAHKRRRSDSPAGRPSPPPVHRRGLGVPR